MRNLFAGALLAFAVVTLGAQDRGSAQLPAETPAQ